MPSLLNRVSSRSTVSRDYKCTVQLLDDAQTMTVDFKKNDDGQVVLDYVCDMLNVVEKDYFGLRYVDTNRHRYWLDTTKPVLRQVKTSAIVFAFRVRFYPADPTIVKEELTRYLLALQLKRDLLHGRLYCPQNDAAVLGAYIAQAELGDYDPQEHKGNYISQFKLFLNQTPKLEEKIAFEHQKLRGKGLTPADADAQFLKKACQLDTYGYYPYTIKDPKAGQVYMGATPHGVLVYQTHRKVHHLRWDDIKEFDYVGKDFYIYPKPEYFDENNIQEEDEEEAVRVRFSENGFNKTEEKNGVHNNSFTSARHDQSIANDSKNGNKKRPALRFNCPSAVFCKHLWKYMLAQQVFFTKQRSNDVKPIAIRRGPLFRRATFRYTGRVLQEIKEAPPPKRAEPSFERIHVQRQMARDERNAPWANKFHTLPRATKPAADVHDHTMPMASKEAPDQHDSLILDSLLQPTPIATPMSGVSPGSQNGYPSLNITGGSADTSFSNDSFARQKTTTTTTTKLMPDGSTYKSETITVSLKHVEPLGDTKLTSFDSGYENQLPLGSSTPLPSDGDYSNNVYAKREQQELIKTATQEKCGDAITEISTQKSVSKVVLKPTRNGGGGVGRALVKSVLTGLMFTILVIGTIIVIMEVQDPQFRRFLHQMPGEDVFRHEYYEPGRRRALEWYERVANRK